MVVCGGRFGWFSYMLVLIFVAAVSCLFRSVPDPCAGSDGDVRW